MVGVKTKVCTKCVKEKDIGDFNRTKIQKDGMQPWCKECSRKYYLEHKDEVKERSRKYRLEHQDEVKERSRKYNKCVTKPSCPFVGGHGAEFMIFECETCGAEFRKLKSYVDWMYEHRGHIPKYCSRNCYFIGKKK